MAWPPPSTLPDDPLVATWWLKAAAKEADEARERAEVEARREAKEAAWYRAGAVARADRYVRAANEAIAEYEARRAARSVESRLGQVELRNASVAGVSSAARIIELVAAPYEEPALVEFRGELWSEEFLRGAFSGIEARQDSVRVNRDHDRTKTVGRVVRWWPERSEGLVSEVRVAPTDLGDETLALASEDCLSASVGFMVGGQDQVLDRSSKTRQILKAFVDHLAFVSSPAYEGSRVLAVRSS